MSDPTAMEAYARRVFRDAAVARRRSLLRQVGGPLVRKYLQVVPSVFTARGEFAPFRLRLPAAEALERLRGRAVLTLDSATEVLGGFRFGRRGSEYAYLPSADVLASIAAEGIGERSSAKEFPMSWAPPGWEMLFAVIPSQLPPHLERGGSRVVTPEFLIRDLLGFYGLRTDLLAEIEAKLK